MRIALVSPLAESVPPRTYGGTERVVSTLANRLTWNGHDVTVFATADSRVDARLVACRDRPIMTDPRLCAGLADHLTMLRRVLAEHTSFDVIHVHLEDLHFPLFERIAAKTLTTFHGRLDAVGLSEFFGPYRHFPVVSVSDSQRRPLPWLNWRATVPHGYPADQYRPIPRREGDGEPYLAFLGRMSPEKGVLRAIEIARRSGRRLKIAARINDFDRLFFENEVRREIDGDRVQYVGEIDDARKSEFLSAAEALLFPITWPEPFGLVMIEAMACGVPTIAFRAGATPEVVEDGVTGALVDNCDEAVAAVAALDRFDRSRIRARFEEKFTDAAMAEGYERVYREMAGRTAQRDARRLRGRSMKPLKSGGAGDDGADVGFVGGAPNVG